MNVEALKVTGTESAMCAPKNILYSYTKLETYDSKGMMPQTLIVQVEASGHQ